MWLLIMGCIAVFSLAVFFFGKHDPALLSSPTETSRPARQYSVYYGNGIFSPTNLRIRVNDSVAFRNESSDAIALVGDTIVSGDMAPRAIYTHAFSEAGVYTYMNMNNTAEKGTITVQQ